MKSAVTLGLAVLCMASPSLASGARSSKARVSPNGRYSIQLTKNADGSCRLEVVKERETAWSLNDCVGGPDDLYFVSDDGERFWVVYTLPEKTVRRPKRAKGAAWTYAKVAAKYDREGHVLKLKRLRDFIRTRSGLGDVRQLEKHFKWLEGEVGVPGRPPRLNDAGQVELNTLEHKQYKLQF